MTTPDHPHAANEAKALRHVLQLDELRRPEALAELADATLHLVGLVKAVDRELVTKPAITLADVVAMLDRPALQAEAELARPHLDAPGIDPDAAGHAYGAVLQHAQETAEARRIDAAMGALTKAHAATDPKERAQALDRVRDELNPARLRDRQTLAELWNHHRELAFTAHAQARPEEAILLHSRRGEWAQWFNAWLGPRGALEPGRTLLLGGGPGGGKTSLAAALAVDAMAAGCPVLFWQLELGRAETVEHIMAQLPDAGAWWEESFRKRANVDLPKAWATLLDIPRADDLAANQAETIREALVAQAGRCERLRRQGSLNHAANGLVVVDYVQLLTIRDKGPKDAGHEVLTTAASLLAKAAAEAGACLVLLSQVTKEVRKKSTPKETPKEAEPRVVDDTGFSGADLARMAHAAMEIVRYDDDTRRLYWKKDRGRLGTPERERTLHVVNRALVDADATEESPY